MTNNLDFVDLLPTLVILALTVVVILYSTKIVEGVEQLIGKKKPALPKSHSKPLDR